MKRLLLVLPLLALLALPVHAQAGPQFFYVVTTVDSNNFESVFSTQVTATFGQGQSKANLAWTAATVPVGGTPVKGYNVYRGTVSGGPYVKINTVLVTGVTFTDAFVLPNAPSGLSATIS